MAVVLKGNQFNQFLNNNSKVIVMYSAKGCDACSSMMELVDYVAQKWYLKIKICILYNDENPNTFKTFPTFVGYHNKKRVFSPVSYDFNCKNNFKVLVKNVINLK